MFNTSAMPQAIDFERFAEGSFVHFRSSPFRPLDKRKSSHKQVLFGILTLLFAAVSNGTADTSWSRPACL
jgi:hypothetical protein